MKNVIFDDKRRGGGLDGFDVAFYSDIGRRSSQQDSAYLMAGEQAAFAVLCDGMGGARGGQLASASAVDILRAYYAHYLVHGREMQDSAWMREAAEAADNMVHGLRDAGGNPLGAGTTLVAVSAVRDYFGWISVGDSRLYIHGVICDCFEHLVCQAVSIRSCFNLLNCFNPASIDSKTYSNNV